MQQPGGSPLDPSAGPCDPEVARLAAAPGLRDYRLLGVLARGGQGAVYRARHAVSGLEVAVKLLLDPDEAGPARMRFAREAAVLSRLRHPHLPRVLDHGGVAAGAFIVLEFVRGLDLRRLVEQRGLPTAAWTRRTLATIAGALDALHAQGLVHRDVKPANILIEVRADRPDLARGGEHVPERPILVDLGLAKQVRWSAGAAVGSPWTAWDPLTQTGQLVGTPAFMAPEQAAGEPVGPWTDVYALGAVLYYLLTGTNPFAGAGAWEVLVKVLGGRLTPPGQLAPVPPDLEALCLRAMAPDPADRPRSAAALAEALLGT